MEDISSGNLVPTPEQLEHEIEACQAAIIGHLHMWLASMEGRKFASLDECRQTLQQVSRLVRKAGRKLLFDGERVHLTAGTGTRQTTPSIVIRANRQGKGTHVTSSVSFPKLSTVSVE